MTKVAAAAVAMGVAVWAVDGVLSRVLSPATDGFAIRLVAGAVVGIGAYLLTAWSLRSPELGEVKDLMTAVLKRL